MTTGPGIERKDSRAQVRLDTVCPRDTRDALDQDGPPAIAQ